MKTLIILFVLSLSVNIIFSHDVCEGYRCSGGLVCENINEIPTCVQPSTSSSGSSSSSGDNYGVCANYRCSGGLVCVNQNGVATCVHPSTSSSSSSSSGGNVCDNYRCSGGLICVNQNGVATCVHPSTSSSGSSSSGGSTSSGGSGNICDGVKCVGGSHCVVINGYAQCINPNNVCSGVVCSGGLVCINQNGYPTCINNGTSTTGSWTSSSSWYETCYKHKCPNGYVCASVHGRPQCLLGSCQYYNSDPCHDVKCVKGYKCKEIDGTGVCYPISTPKPIDIECQRLKCGPDEVCCNPQNIGAACINICSFSHCDQGLQCFVLNRKPICLPPNTFTTSGIQTTASSMSTTITSSSTTSTFDTPISTFGVISGVSSTTGSTFASTTIVPTIGTTIARTTGDPPTRSIPLTDTTTGLVNFNEQSEELFSLGGFVWLDAGNGIPKLDGSDVFLKDIEIEVFRSFLSIGKFKSNELYNGWEISNVQPGYFCIQATFSANYEVAPQSPFNPFNGRGRVCTDINLQSYHNGHLVVNGQGVIRFNLGLLLRERFKIAGFAWLDSDENGIHETDEPYLSGITVRLVGEVGVRDATTIQDYDGYVFNNIQPGHYCISITDPSGKYKQGPEGPYHTLPGKSCFDINRETVELGEFLTNDEGVIRFNLGMVLA